MNPNPSAFDDLVQENAALQIENAYLWNQVNTLEIEKSDLIAENASLVDKFNEYMYLHPKRVGVKSGKAYEIKPPIPQNSISTNPDELLERKKRNLVDQRSPKDFSVTSGLTFPTWYIMPSVSSLMITSAGENNDVSIW